MVCGLDKKGNIKKNKFLVPLILVFSFLTLGCDPHYNEYPYVNKSIWVCTSPSISLTYSRADNGTMEQIEILEMDGTVTEIDLLFQSNFYVAYPAGSTNHNDRLFGGSWCYRNGNLILDIEEDFIFDHQFDELEFVPQDVN